MPWFTLPASGPRTPRRAVVVSFALAVVFAACTACSPSAAETSTTHPANDVLSAGASGEVSSSLSPPEPGGSAGASAETGEDIGTAPSEDDVAENASSALPSAAPPTAPPLDRAPSAGKAVTVDSSRRVVQRLGKAGVLSRPGSTDAALRVSVQHVEFMDTCTMRGFGQRLKPQRGRFALVSVEASLSARDQGNVGLTARSFIPTDGSGKALASDGWSEEAESCEVTPIVDVMLYPGDSTAGVLVLDVPPSTQRVAFDIDGSPGWSWPVR